VRHGLTGQHVGLELRRAAADLAVRVDNGRDAIGGEPLIRVSTSITSSGFTCCIYESADNADSTLPKPILSCSRRRFLRIRLSRKSS